MTNRQVKKKVCGLSLLIFYFGLGENCVNHFLNGHWPHLQLAKHENMPTPGRSTMKISTRNWRRKNQNEKCQKKYKLYVCVLFWLVACVLQKPGQPHFHCNRTKMKAWCLELGPNLGAPAKDFTSQAKSSKKPQHLALGFIVCHWGGVKCG